MWSQHIELSRASVVTVCMVLQQQLLSRGVGSITISSSFVNLPVQNLIEVSFILLGVHNTYLGIVFTLKISQSEGGYV